MVHNQQFFSISLLKRSGFLGKAASWPSLDVLAPENLRSCQPSPRTWKRCLELSTWTEVVPTCRSRPGNSLQIVQGLMLKFKQQSA